MADNNLMLNRIDRNEERLNKHSDRLKELENHKSRTEVQIENLIIQISSLVTTIKWVMGVIITTSVGFFIWYVQNIK